MTDVRIYFPDGTERVLFRHSDEMPLAEVYRRLLDASGDALDPEERFQLSLVRTDDAGAVEKVANIAIVGDAVESIEWLDPDSRFGRVGGRTP